jgi:4,5-DOPA dioxygenase extradiol
VLIIGSGNMVHNLGMVAWDKFNVDNYGFDWAIEMNSLFKKNILDHNHQALIDYTKLSKSATLAIPSPDHYIPLIYTLGLQDSKDETTLFNDKYVAGSLNMTSVSFAHKKILAPEPSQKDSTGLDSSGQQQQEG